MNTHLLQSVHVNGMRITYREAGDGPPVLLVHGWPTSSFLWRRVMDPVARRNRVVAIDLPGFGGSAKPTDARYDFPFFDGLLDTFLDVLTIDRVAIGLHDLGGPIGLHWAMRRPERVSGIALLNTLVYPEFSEAVVDFVRTLSEPEPRARLTSDEGLAEIMRLGVANEAQVTPQLVAELTAPFSSADDRLALARAGIGLQPDGFAEIARWLPSVSVPLRIIYGEQDQILPDVAETMARVATDVPHARVTSLPDCGHFLQEDAPDQVGDLLASFFADSAVNQPDAELKKLDKLVGRWNVTGEATGTIEYEWMEGGHFLLQHVDLDHRGHNVKGLEVIGRLLLFGDEAPSEDIKSRYYGDQGETFDYVYELSDDTTTLTIWGGEKGSPARYDGTFSADGTVLTGAWDFPGGGGYRTTSTKTPSIP